MGVLRTSSGIVDFSKPLHFCGAQCPHLYTRHKNGERNQVFRNEKWRKSSQEHKETMNIRNQPCILTTPTKSVHLCRKNKRRIGHTIYWDTQIGNILATNMNMGGLPVPAQRWHGQIHCPLQTHHVKDKHSLVWYLPSAAHSGHILVTPNPLFCNTPFGFLITSWPGHTLSCIKKVRNIWSYVLCHRLNKLCTRYRWLSVLP